MLANNSVQLKLHDSVSHKIQVFPVEVSIIIKSLAIIEKVIYIRGCQQIIRKQLKPLDIMSQIYTLNPGLPSRGVNNSSTCIRYMTCLCSADISITAQDIYFCIQRYDISITMNQTVLLNLECTNVYTNQCYIHQPIIHQHG